jgi:hypothetical protein
MGDNLHSTNPSFEHTLLTPDSPPLDGRHRGPLIERGVLLTTLNTLPTYFDTVCLIRPSLMIWEL